MPTIPKITPIDFLVGKRFPRPASSLGRSVSGVGWFPAEDWSEDQHPLYEEIKKYRAELALKAPEEVDLMCEQIRQAERELAEKKRFFNKNNAQADFVHWAKATYWTLEEAVALVFGKNPECVNKKTMTAKYLDDFGFFQSPFVKEYNKVVDLAERAKNWKQLYDPTYPSLFLVWAKKNSIPVPSLLDEQVTLRNGNLLDWKNLYDELLAKHNSFAEKANEAISQRDGYIAKLEACSKSLEEKVSSLETKSTQTEALCKPINAKERDTFLKMIIGMAMGGYAYDPSAAKSHATNEIYGDLLLRGIRLDQDTIRNKLKEATLLVDSDKTGIE